MVEEAKQKGATVVIGGQASTVGELHYQWVFLKLSIDNDKDKDNATHKDKPARWENFTTSESS